MKAFRIRGHGGLFGGCRRPTYFHPEGSRGSGHQSHLSKREEDHDRRRFDLGKCSHSVLPCSSRPDGVQPGGNRSRRGVGAAPFRVAGPLLNCPGACGLTGLPGAERQLRDIAPRTRAPSRSRGRTLCTPRNPSPSKASGCCSRGSGRQGRSSRDRRPDSPGT